MTNKSITITALSFSLKLTYRLIINHFKTFLKMKAIKKAFIKEKQKQTYLKECNKRCCGVYEDDNTSYSVLNQEFYIKQFEDDCKFLDL